MLSSLQNIRCVFGDIIRLAFLKFQVGFGSKKFFFSFSTNKTLITPTGWSFAIWAVIFLFQGIWTVFQLLPNFRSHPYVQKGVSYWYTVVCIAQVGWTFLFTFDLIWPSMIFMSLILLSLAGCVLGSYYQYANSKKTQLEFWFLLFPFSIHFGWLLCATLVNANVVAVWANASSMTQISFAICSLALFPTCSVWSLFVSVRPNYTVPAVICWATLGVYVELSNPKTLVLKTFDAVTIRSIQISTGIIGLLILLLIVIRLFLAVYNQCTSKKIDKMKPE